MTTRRVIYDTSAFLSSMTPVPNRGSIIWDWMESRLVQVIVSDYLIRELTEKLAEPRFRLTTAQQDSIIAEYLHHALTFNVSSRRAGGVASGTTRRGFTGLSIDASGQAGHGRISPARAHRG